MARREDFTVEEIKARARPLAVALANALGLFGRMDHKGCYWVKDPRRADGGNLTSFSIDTRRGIWKNFAAADESGDILTLVAVFACAGDKRKSVPWLKAWLGLTGRAPDKAETARLVERAHAQAAEDAEAAARRRAGALKLWLDGRPLDGTDPASRYLAARGIDVMKLPDGPPRALRFHGAVLAQPERRALPAMVACISGEGQWRGGFMAAHRTYLCEYSGVWQKAFKGEWRDGKKVAAKRALGSYAGGSIRLTRGESGKRLAEAPDGEWIQVGEGIEDALTGALVKPEVRALSAVSLSNIGALILPPQLGGVYILKQNDSDPRTAAQFDAAMDRLASRGIEPAIVEMPARFKDINDALLQKERPHA